LWWLLANNQQITKNSEGFSVFKKTKKYVRSKRDAQRAGNVRQKSQIELKAMLWFERFG
jgi:hypothetical protein